jgi:hypothetical protein
LVDQKNQKMDEKAPEQKRTKRKFAAAEDSLIKQLVDTHGTKQWELIARQVQGRTARQCRDRWKHYLAPGLVARPWQLEEDRLLLGLTSHLGGQWSTLAKLFPGRTDVNLKNRWNKLQRKSKKLARENAVGNGGDRHIQPVGRNDLMPVLPAEGIKSD